MQKFLQLIILLCSMSTGLQAQPGGDLTGTWSGVLLQNEGGFADQFDLYFDVVQIGISLQGKAFVKLGDLMAEMKLRGYQSNSGSWHVTETQILRDDKNGLQVSWCMKQYDLRVEYQDGEQVLTGPWWGSSEYGPCVPGSITLRRRIKIASLLLGGKHAVDVQPHG